MIKGNLILPKVQIENDAKETVKEKQCGIACLNYFFSPQEHEYKM